MCVYGPSPVCVCVWPARAVIEPICRLAPVGPRAQPRSSVAAERRLSSTPPRPPTPPHTPTFNHPHPGVIHTPPPPPPPPAQINSLLKLTPLRRFRQGLHRLEVAAGAGGGSDGEVLAGAVLSADPPPHHHHPLFPHLTATRPCVAPRR